MTTLVTVPQYLASHLTEGKVVGGDYTPAELQRLLDGASEFFAQQCNQPLTQHDEIEVYGLGTQRAAVNSGGQLIVSPRFYPINSVDHIYYRFTPDQTFSDNELTAFSVRDIASAAYSWGATISAPAGYHPFSRGANGGAEIQILYNTGFAEGSVPTDIQDAVIDLTLIAVARGWSAVIEETDALRQIVPPGLMAQVKATAKRYARQF